VPFGDRALHERRDSLTGPLDLAEEAGSLVTCGDGFGDRSLHVAPVDAVAIELANSRIELRVADRGRTHVDPTTAGPEVEGGADHGYRRLVAQPASSSLSLRIGSERVHASRLS
jgi:hypothetical protein